jgi:hypothetical protein
MSPAGLRRPQFSFRHNKLHFAAAGILPYSHCLIHLAGLEGAEHVIWPYTDNLDIPDDFPLETVPLIVYTEDAELDAWMDPVRGTWAYQMYRVR